ncbi:MAG: DUF1080 domain-containing protein [Bacteroidales bacterium]|jgi:hypothetical protein|nr:DUF1080 domain-containing protein [Bacteroidales bacterium]
MRKTNLSTLMLLLILLASSCKQQSMEIFNGKDLSNWEFVLENDAAPANEVYTVSDGVITIAGEPLGYMYTKEKYRNYTLEMEYRWAENASNSGIFVLIEDPTNPFPNGIECQLKAGQAGDFVLLGGSDLNEYTLPEGATERPAFPVIDKLEESSEKPTGEWNKAKIVVLDGDITVYINDVLQNRATSNVMEGHIGLQSEGEAIQFKNIVIS